MKNRKVTYLALSLLISTHISLKSQIVDTVGNTIVRIDSLVGFTGVAQDWPWDLQWGPDTSLWFTVGDKICRYDTTLHSVDTIFKRTASYAIR